MGTSFSARDGEHNATPLGRSGDVCSTDTGGYRFVLENAPHARLNRVPGVGHMTCDE